MEEEEVVESPAPEPKKGGSPVMMIVLIVVIVLLLGGGGFAAWYFFFKPQPVEEEQNGETPIVTEVENPEFKADLVYKGFAEEAQIFNLNLDQRPEDSKYRYNHVKFSFSLLMDDKKVEKVLIERDPLIRNELILVFARGYWDHMDDPQEKEAMAKLIVQRINAVIKDKPDDPGVSQLYYGIFQAQ